MHKKTCLICKNVSWEKEFSIQDIFDEQYNFGRCSSCLVHSLNPFPSNSQLQQAYDDSYYGEGVTKFNSIVEKIIDWFRAQNAKRFSKIIPLNAKVLDIGCGNGSFLYSLSKQGEFKLFGIEPPGKSAQRAGKYKQIELHTGYLEPQTYQPNTFDAIVLTHVFEHLPDPFQSLSVIDRIAKADALLQIEIPNINSWQFRFFKSKWLHLDPPRHLNMFPPQVLIDHLNAGGWQLVSQSFISPQFSPFGFQQSMLNLVCKKREVLYEHLKNNKAYVSSYSSFSLFAQLIFHWLSFPLFVCTDLIASLFKRGATVKLKFRKR